jgi:YHS domain-containing protein
MFTSKKLTFMSNKSMFSTAIKTFFIASLCIIFFASCEKDGGEVNTHEVQGERNVAIKGYDTVAYFKKNKPILGSKDYSHQWNGATWFFSSESNKQAFVKTPESYAPQYGGYCAFGVSVPQKKIDIDPNAWHIFGSKLYLNYTKKTQTIWLEDKNGHIKAANQYWPNVKEK